MSVLYRREAAISLTSSAGAFAGHRTPAARRQCLCRPSASSAWLQPLPCPVSSAARKLRELACQQVRAIGPDTSPVPVSWAASRLMRARCGTCSRLDGFLGGRPTVGTCLRLQPLHLAVHVVDRRADLFGPA